MSIFVYFTAIEYKIKKMKKLLTFIFHVFTIAFMANAQTGIWTGNLDIQGTKLPLVFHLDDENPTVDSPAQGVKGIPIEVTRKENGEIRINIPLIRAGYEGLPEDTRIIGIFKQHGLELPLILTKGEREINRPQTPQPPFPYSTEEVSFSNGDAVLKGTLTLPTGYNRETPVLIMVTGSGLQNRDEEAFEHKPFAVIADALARAGIATLRYDDRGFGESTGDAVNCTTEDLMCDALAGIYLLRERFTNVGVIGHSEGGTIGLILAADKKADFIVSLAGMVISGEETLLDQNRYILLKAGYTEDTVNDYCKILSSIFANDNDTTNRLLADSDLPDTLQQNLQAVISQMKTPYLNYFVSLDMRKRLGDIKCPVLALNGTKDTQVFHEKNIEALKNGLKTNKNAKIKAIDGLNHFFQHCDTGSINEYAAIEETISLEVLNTISKWILSL